MYFKVDKSSAYPEEYKIYINEKVHSKINTSIDGSYKVLFARLLGLEYHDFCRFVRSKYNANLHGRQGGYITFTFEKKEEANKFKDNVEKRWKTLIE